MKAVSTSLAALLLLCVSSLPLAAQTAPAGAHDNDPALIRVYANLLQIPVLVLNAYRQPVKPIESNRFTIQFDGGTPIRPQLVRPEGEDPITLAVLVDTSSRNRLLPHLADAMATLTPGQLGWHDRIVIYETDGCRLLRMAEMLPVQRALVRAHVETAAMHQPYDGSAGACKTNMTLWKSIAVVAAALSDQPGRRVLLAITNGIDKTSDFDAKRAHLFSMENGVAIFSVAERGQVPAGPALSPAMLASTGGRGGRGFSGGAGPVVSTPSDLATLSETSGGVMLETDPRGLAATLSRFVSLVRGRYVVEFRRPNELIAGNHVLTVSVGQSNYFVTHAGTSMPIAATQPDPAVEHGPLSSRPPDPDQFAPDPTPSTVK